MKKSVSEFHSKSEPHDYDSDSANKDVSRRNFMKAMTAASAAAAIAPAMSGISLAGGDESPVPVMRLSFKGVVRPAQPKLLGHNFAPYDWSGQVHANKPIFFDIETHGFDPAWYALTHAMPVHIMRYNWGNKFPWKQAVGPLVDRKPISGLYNGYYNIEPGFDEYLRWVESLPNPSAASLIASPFRPVREVADLVAYCNATTGPMAEWRAANGHPRPYHVKHWELGNEVDWLGRADVNVMRSEKPLKQRNYLTVGEYIRQCRPRIAAMRKVDPTIKIYAQAKTAPPFEVTDTWAAWHRAVLAQIGNDIDGITVHTYYDGYPVPNMLHTIDAITHDFDRLGQTSRPLSVWVSEHSRWVDYNNKTVWPQSWSVQGAISTGDFLIGLYERQQVEMANYWYYADAGPWRVLNADWAQGANDKFGTGAFFLYRLFNIAHAPKVQSMHVNPGTWRGNPTHYPYTVRAMMFLDPASGKRALVAINRSATQAFDLAMDTAIAPGVSVKRLVVTGASLSATNVAASPHAVTLAEDTRWGHTNGDGASLFRLPARSVTAWIWTLPEPK